MLIVLLLTLTILISIVTHSMIIVFFWFLLILLLSIFNIWKFTKHNILTSLIVIVIWYCSVLYYDTRVWWNDVTAATWSDEFVVVSKPRLWRYIIESYPQWTSHSTMIALYSTQSLMLGDVISITQRPIPREYSPIMCLWVCTESNFSSSDVLSRLLTIALPNGFSSWGRQSGHVVDNYAFSFQKIIGNLFESKDFNYDGRLYMQGIDATLYDNNVTIHKHANLWFFVQVRNTIFRTIAQKFGATIQWWLLLGMTIGDRSLISQERYDQFIDSGLVHLIAVSGGNIAIIVIFFGFVLFWVPFYIRQCILFVVVIWYALLVWWDTSVIRATIMWLLTMLALFPGRQISIWRSLAYARCLMLLYNPYYIVYDMWFLLSFGAILGIVRGEQKYHLLFNQQSSSQDKQLVTVSSRLYKFLKIFVKLYVVPTIGAMVWVLPLLLWSMWQINIITPLINILIVPLVPLVTIMWFVVSLIPVGILSSYIQLFLSLIIDYILWLSVVGTRYAVIIQIDFWLAIFLLLCVLWYWIYRIDTQKE